MRLRLLLIIGALALAAPAGVLAEQAARPSSAYRMIVNASNPETVVTRRFVEDAFLKKVKSWPSGEVIYPADLTPSAEVRPRFTQEMLRRSVEAVRAYWQRLIFS